MKKYISAEELSAMISLQTTSERQKQLEQIYEDVESSYLKTIERLAASWTKLQAKQIQKTYYNIVLWSDNPLDNVFVRQTSCEMSWQIWFQSQILTIFCSVKGTCDKIGLADIWDIENRIVLYIIVPLPC